MENIYDLIIIGSGPAGLTAGIYASRAQLNTIIIEKEEFSGGQVVYTERIDNYPGIPGVSGMELAERFRSHCEQMGAAFVAGEVVRVNLKESKKIVELEDGSTYYARAVVIATGAKSRMLGVKGEQEFAGMGVSYCATCDGAFFQNQTVAVIGGGDVAVEDALYLSKICKKVYLIHRRNELRATKILCSQVKKCENVEILWESKVNEIVGNEEVEKIVITSTTHEESKEVEVQGVFVAIGNVPLSSLYEGQIDMDESGWIIADESCKTSQKGVFAVGDIRKKPLKQIITAASDGANSITAVEQYIFEINETENVVI